MINKWWVQNLVKLVIYNVREPWTGDPWTGEPWYRQGPGHISRTARGGQQNEVRHARLAQGNPLGRLE